MAPDVKTVVKVRRKVKISSGEKLNKKSNKQKKMKSLYGDRAEKKESTTVVAADDIKTELSTSLKPAEKLGPMLTPDGFRRQHQVKISGDGDPAKPFVLPDPMMNFDSTPFAKSICQGIK